ncbi:MAG TPA: hypothetical protein ENH52_10780 [Nitrospirae bacterium]|nr:hypothetical protein [Nitrospirota bacterium]
MENNNALETHKEPETAVGYTVVGVRFRSCGKIYTFDVDDIDVAPGSQVVVDSEMGLSLGRVVTPGHIIKKTENPLKKIIRIATDKDFETVKNNRSLEDEARAFCMDKVKILKLPMKIVVTETTLDKKRLIFYFTADGRIDFRGLVRDLAAKFKTRIEMRQIGVRDEVKLLGGFGVCGRQTCCSLFLSSFAPITIRMAKQQDLSINQSKLSGICGRLMCCLGYEFREFSEASAAKDKALVTVAEENAGNNLQAAGSEQTDADKDREAPTFKGRTNIITKGKEGIALPQPEKQQEKPAEKAAEEKKHFKREPRRRKRRRPEKPTHKPAQGEQKESAAPVKPAGQPESKDKGRPFNRRRKFWKKKKN